MPSVGTHGQAEGPAVTIDRYMLRTMRTILSLLDVALAPEHYGEASDDDVLMLRAARDHVRAAEHSLELVTRAMVDVERARGIARNDSCGYPFDFCSKCGRSRPLTPIADPTCPLGGYCQWEGRPPTSV
jgi:hypothetical protein